MMQNVAIGQRWMSEMEPELGLGLIQAVDHRLVTVFFPAGGETRTYAQTNAPLLRIQFKPGDHIETVEGERLQVRAVETVQGVLVYEVQAPSAAHAIMRLPESELSHRLQLTQAVDRLFAKHLDAPRWFALRHAALQAQQQDQHAQVKGLIGPRTALMPHQLYIAHEVANRYAPRVLLADEVGLGKTIEAGLIMHQQLLTQRAQRVLIVVPQALVSQWFIEMLRRFHLHFSIFDVERVASLSGEQGQNPFLSAQLILCSVDFLLQCDLDQLAAAPWDLLVVDEAHHLAWDVDQASPEYVAVEHLATHAAGLLLLTATPEQLGRESHFARLRLLDADRFHAYDAFLEEQQHYQAIADLAVALHEHAVWSDELKAQAAPYVPEIAIDESKREAIVQALLDRHGTSRVLFRNTRKNISGFPKRHVHRHALPYPQLYSTPEPDDPEEWERLLYPEIVCADANWWLTDTRVQWLRTFLLQHPREKVLVICAHSSTAIGLASYYRLTCGLSVSVFHEEMEMISRDRAAAYFAAQTDGAQALICSEIGSEGRNFQFARHVVLLDLPRHPGLLEQRIGRLDRIGQQRDMHIHVPYFDGHAQAVMVCWYHEGLDAFEHINPAGSQIYEACASALLQSLRAPQDTAALGALIAQTRQMTATLKAELEAGRDRLLELSSCNRAVAEQLVQQITQAEKDRPKAFMEAVFDSFGVDSEAHSEHCDLVQPSDHMYIASFPHVPEDGVMVSYDRQTALVRDEVQFLTWEHPMVLGAIDLVLTQDSGKACVCVFKRQDLKPGTVLLEALYTLTSVAPPHLQAQRFLPSTLMRILTDAQGQNLTHVIEHDDVNLSGTPLDRSLAGQVVERFEAELRRMIEASQALANTETQARIEAALAHLHTTQQDEIDRLLALRARNPNIRDDEIAFLEHQTEQLLGYLRDTRCQLDSVRILIVPPK